MEKKRGQRPIKIQFEGYELEIPLWERPGEPEHFFILPSPVLLPTSVLSVWDPLTAKYLVKMVADLANKKFMQSVVDQVSRILRKDTKINIIPILYARFLLNEELRDLEIDPWIVCREHWISVDPEKPFCGIELECPNKETALELAGRIRKDPQSFADRWHISFAIPSRQPSQELSEVNISGRDFLNTKICRAAEVWRIIEGGVFLLNERDSKTWAAQIAEKIGIDSMEVDGVLLEIQEREDIRKRIHSMLTSFPVRYPTRFNGSWENVFWSKPYMRPDRVIRFLNSRVSEVHYHRGFALFYKTTPRLNENSLEGHLLSELKFLLGPYARKEGENIIFNEADVMRYFQAVGSPVYYSKNNHAFCIDDFTLYEVDVNHLSHLMMHPRWMKRRKVHPTSPSPIISLPSPPQTNFKGSMQNLMNLPEERSIQKVQAVSVPINGPKPMRVLRSPSRASTPILRSPKPSERYPPLTLRLPQYREQFLTVPTNGPNMQVMRSGPIHASNQSIPAEIPIAPPKYSQVVKRSIREEPDPVPTQSEPLNRHLPTPKQTGADKKTTAAKTGLDDSNKKTNEVNKSQKSNERREYGQNRFPRREKTRSRSVDGTASSRIKKEREKQNTGETNPGKNHKETRKNENIVSQNLVSNGKKRTQSTEAQTYLSYRQPDPDSSANISGLFLEPPPTSTPTHTPSTARRVYKDSVESFMLELNDWPDDIFVQYEDVFTPGVTNINSEFGKRTQDLPNLPKRRNSMKELNIFDI